MSRMFDRKLPTAAPPKRFPLPDDLCYTLPQDRYYTARASEYSYGWKEHIATLAKGGNIVSVAYNAENASGFIKSWDNVYIRTMLHANGTYPQCVPTTTQAGSWRGRERAASMPSPGRPPPTSRSTSWHRLYWSRRRRRTPALRSQTQLINGKNWIPWRGFSIGLPRAQVTHRRHSEW